VFVVCVIYERVCCNLLSSTCWMCTDQQPFTVSTGISHRYRCHRCIEMAFSHTNRGHYNIEVAFSYSYRGHRFIEVAFSLRYRGLHCIECHFPIGIGVFTV